MPRGYRNICVGGHELQWCFRDITIVRPVKGGARLILDSVWVDPWLTPEQSDPNDPITISPGWVRAGIEFALSHGWQPESNNNLRVCFRDGEFEVADDV
jgi:hypothetical protein